MTDRAHESITVGGVSTNIDSARGNLAGTFVNAFVNAGFGNDKLMVMAEEGNSWIYKNKDHGMCWPLSAWRPTHAFFVKV